MADDAATRLVHAVLGVLHRMVWADGSADPREITVGIDVARKMLGELFIEDEVTGVLSTAKGPQIDLTALPEDARIIVLRAAAAVASADDVIDPGEVFAIRQLGLQMGVNASIIEGMVAGVEADTEARKEMDALRSVAAGILGVDLDASAAEILIRYRQLSEESDDDQLLWAYHTLLS